ncbi:hypothetical protein H1220_03325 [Carnobacteriaceae bacterium zg-84]|uniref:hypothetical protein n=1 Tax=Granulicatella sp. zg-84 TaxID=2678503 RepID=UPI0013C0CDF7|nr:hypothetical protein [Granulicatella sp. zg-84]NEW65856.1 hypothetical protein [Granulicatella sp. zg-84]QMI86393.1 hypothetical protein H1220_03325 [Carnobacteriaceae bacterium zg-84]
MIDFPNYLIHNGYPRLEKRQMKSEIVLSKPFQHVRDEQAKQRYEKKRDDELKQLEKRQSRPFVRSEVPSLLKGMEKKTPVDYRSLYGRLSVSEEDLLLFAENSRQLYHDLSKLSQLLEEETQSHPDVNKKAKKVQKRGLNRSINGILEQENRDIAYLSNRVERENIYD